uniref:CalL n=1 Tax=uncultured Candidatus Entotheonella sp. TaxID=312019 RepID=A0A068PCE0_9BACT|nr:CalL [uncultured Candidatus Entotheonella sp.]
MQARSTTPPEGFDIRVCERELPAATKSVVFAKKPLPLAKRKPRRIVIIGDTGCRVFTYKTMVDVQNCNGVEGYGPAWPFPKIATAVAAARPDLIIHLGDYHYRETPCPKGNKGCAGSPSGFTWPSWEADFFAPARDLLTRAPWVFIRGNHESCARAWLGWFYLLDPNPLPANPWQASQCPAISDPYPISLESLQLLVQDSSGVHYSPKGHEASVALYTKVYNEVNKMVSASSENWSLTHEPIWGIQPGATPQGTVLYPLQLTLQAALKKTSLGRFDPRIGFLLSGHVHLFESFNFTDGRPPMMVIGNSGTKRSPSITNKVLEGSKILQTLGVAPADFISEDDFNYALAEAFGDGWEISLYKLNGDVSKKFVLKNKKMVSKSQLK